MERRGSSAHLWGLLVSSLRLDLTHTLGVGVVGSGVVRFHVLVFGGMEKEGKEGLHVLVLCVCRCVCVEICIRWMVQRCSDIHS